MRIPTSFLALSFLLSLTAPAAMAASSSDISPELIKQNLAKIPPTDPVVGNPPKLLDAVKGQHPRLLFTAKEIDDLKARIASDPILKKTYEDVSARSKRFKLDPKIAAQLISNDTAALSIANGDYPSLAYAYALDHDDLDLYGAHVALDFVGRIRGQVRFEGPDAMAELMATMAHDVEASRLLLAPPPA